MVTTIDLTPWAPRTEDCPLCSAVIWRMFALGRDGSAYMILIDPGGSPKTAYRPPAEPDERLAWPRFALDGPVPLVRHADDGVLWAHHCYVTSPPLPLEVYPEEIAAG